jgi:predicted RNA binding protein YcfA (HicA-like mRNA interferase family)
VKLPAVSGKEVFNALIRNGWVEIRTGASSHRFLKHPNRGGLVTVPYTTKDLPKGTLNSILKQAGLKAPELHQML